MVESVHERCAALYRTVFFLPVLTSAVGVAIIWGFVLHPQNGLLNGLISRLTGKVTVIAWIDRPDLVFLGLPIALVAMIVAYLWQDIGYNLVIFIAALQAIPRSVNDAARVDGASAWQTFRYITLPLLKPTILLASVADDDLGVPGVRPVPGHDERRPRRPDAGALARHLRERVPLPAHGLGRRDVGRAVPARVRDLARAVAVPAANWEY